MTPLNFGGRLPVSESGQSSPARRKGKTMKTAKMSKTHLASVLSVGAARTAGYYVRVGETKAGGYQYAGPFLTRSHAVVFAQLAFPNEPTGREPVEDWAGSDVSASLAEGSGDRFDLPTDRFVDWAGWPHKPDAVTVANLLSDAELHG